MVFSKQILHWKSGKFPGFCFVLLPPILNGLIVLASFFILMSSRVTILTIHDMIVYSGNFDNFYGNSVCLNSQISVMYYLSCTCIRYYFQCFLNLFLSLYSSDTRILARALLAGPRFSLLFSFVVGFGELETCFHLQNLTD